MVDLFGFLSQGSNLGVSRVSLLRPTGHPRGTSLRAFHSESVFCLFYASCSQAISASDTRRSKASRRVRHMNCMLTRDFASGTT